MNYNFIFFCVDTFRPEISNQYIKIERESIGYFIDSIKKYHPQCSITHCTDLLTKSFHGVDNVHRTQFDPNYLMYGKIKSFSTLKINKTSIYLDPDMLIMKNIPIDKFIDRADVFLLKRSFNNYSNLPLFFRNLKFTKHKSKNYITIYPYVACFVICKKEIFWERCLKYFDQIENVYKIWFGDQEIFRKMVENNEFSFGFVEEKDFACPPQYLTGNTRPFIVHFKGKINKKIMSKYYNYV